MLGVISACPDYPQHFHLNDFLPFVFSVSPSQFSFRLVRIVTYFYVVFFMPIFEFLFEQGQPNKILSSVYFARTTQNNSCFLFFQNWSIKQFVYSINQDNFIIHNDIFFDNWNLNLIYFKSLALRVNSLVFAIIYNKINTMEMAGTSTVKIFPFCLENCQFHMLVYCNTWW